MSFQDVSQWRSSLRDECHRLRARYVAAGWREEVKPEGSRAVQVGRRLAPSALLVEEESVLPTDSTYWVETFEFHCWTFPHIVLARSGIDEAWTTVDQARAVGMDASMGCLPLRAGKDPGQARQLLTQRGYTNRRVKRMPISVLRKVARRRWPRPVHIAIHVMVAVDPQSKQVFLRGHHNEDWLVWAVLDRMGIKR